MPCQGVAQFPHRPCWMGEGGPDEFVPPPLTRPDSVLVDEQEALLVVEMDGEELRVALEGLV
eukprot:13850468-Alexandrium_andersonii.AAC.1